MAGTEQLIAAEGGAGSAASRFRVPEGTQSAVLSIAGIGSVLLLWAIAGSTTRFVAPIGEVFGTLPEFLSRGQVWSSVAETWARVLESLALGLVLGTAAAIAMWRLGFFGRVVSCYVTVMLAVPSTITALLGVFIFTNVGVGAVVVLAVTVAPFIAIVVHGALERTDPGLTEMAHSYRLGRWERWRVVLIPQVAGAAMAAVRNEHAHAWKVVVVVELFLVSSGMGFRFDRAFGRFDLVDVMHWLMVFSAILLVSEYLVIRPLEKRAQKWKAIA